MTPDAAGLAYLRATYSNLQTTYNRKTGKIDLTFEARLSTPGLNYSLTISPRLAKDGKEAPAALVNLAQLPNYVMEGDWYKNSRLRKQRSRRPVPDYSRSVLMHPTSAFTYKASISQNDWVEGVTVVVYTTLTSYKGVVAQSVFRFTTKQTLAYDEDLQPSPSDNIPVTQLPFVERVNSVNREIVSGNASIEAVEAYIETNGEGSLTIHFELASSRINPDFMSNNRTLNELLNVISEMRRTNNPPQVVIVGYASPEGQADFNRRLATERARSVQNYIASGTELNRSEIITYDGGINWAGLKRLALADYNLPRRSEALRILEIPIWDANTRTGRLGSLMRLAGGEPYRYMTDVYFPQLRGAAFIKVFYK
jgi:outer membrane protein OmpA-like peptidoglycan-associated protein